MNAVTTAKKSVIQQAKEEVAKELANKNIGVLKALYKKQQLAEVALANINREIEEAELAVEQGNEIV